MSENKKNKKIWTIVIAILLALVFGWREYSHYTDIQDMADSYKATVNFHKGEAAQFKNSLDLKVADEFIMKQNIVSSEIANEQLKDEIKGFKNINSYMKMEVLEVIKNLEIKYSEANIKNPFEGIILKDDEYLHKDDVAENFLRLPKTFKEESDSGWFYIAGVINKESLTIDSLSMFNKFDATIGLKKSEKKFSWLRKKEPVVSLKSYNPYTKIVYVNNVVVDNDKGKVGNILFSKPAMFLYGFVGGMAYSNKK